MCLTVNILSSDTIVRVAVTRAEQLGYRYRTTMRILTVRGVVKLLSSFEYKCADIAPKDSQLTSTTLRAVCSPRDTAARPNSRTHEPHESACG